ncbi:MAG: hypothetical protein C0402_11560 [Thermodesulfovibrio sp.]|nr:hypothetical protein [Thermodesulfovibrio sp.]
MTALTRLLLLITAIGLVGCVQQARIHAPLQPDGWSAQPVSVACRFAPDADLDPATRTPVGDEGYYLYILIDIAGNRDFSTPLSVAFSFKKNPGGHSWIMLESPQSRLEYGHNGNFGLGKLHYLEGVYQRFRDNHPDPIAYLWEVMDDGRLEAKRNEHTPTFVWRMPITKQRHQMIYEYVTQRTYDQFSLRDNNCADMVTDAAALAGINLSRRLRLTIPQETEILGRKLRVWTDTKYRILEFSTPDVLLLDLRHLAQFGIGSDVTEWYLGLKQ